MNNPISFKDLFATDLIESIKGLQGEIDAVRQKLLQTIEDAKKLATNIKGGRTNGGKPSVPQVDPNETKKVDDLYNSYNKLGVNLKKLEQESKALQKATNDLTFSQKEQNKVNKLGSEYDKTRESSYNQLSKQYRAMKIVINQLTQEERENTEEGKALVDNARRIYEQMNMLQQKTGKYTLQVGHYSKAFNGLNLATQQVVRELPVMAFGFDRFIMAISNNLPILWDNVNIARQEVEARKAQKAALLASADAAKVAAGEAMKLESVGKMLLKSLISWQTVMLVILTVLPNIIQKMNEKRKEAKELEEQNKKLASSEEKVKKVIEDVTKAQTSAISKIITMTSIMQDQNRSVNDRIEAGRVLKQTFDKELDGYTDQEIAMGKAKDAIDRITESLKEQAKARAINDALAELYTKQIQLEPKVKEIGETKISGVGGSSSIAALSRKLQEPAIREQYEKAFGESDFTKWVDRSVFGKVDRFVSEKILGFEPKEEGIDIFAKLDEYNQAMKEYRANQKAIEELVGMIDPAGLLEEESEGGTGGVKGIDATIKTVTDKTLGYFRELEKLRASIVVDPEEREVEMNRVSYQQQIDDLKIFLLEQQQLREEGKLDELQISEQGEEAIMEMIKILQGKQFVEEGNIRRKHEERRRKEAEAKERELERITKEHMDAEIKTIKDQADTLDSEAIVTYKNRLNRRKEFIKNEKKYLLEYMKILEDYGKLEPEAKKSILARVDALEVEEQEIKPKDVLGWLGMVVDEDYKEDFKRAISDAFSTTFDYMNQWMDKRREMAQVAIESAEEEVNAAKHALDIEQQARANGYAHNVSLARAEYEKKLMIKEKALKEDERIAKAQQAIDDAQQISSLLVATANIWAAYTKGNVLGAVLAGIATASMWASFAAAKVQAASVVKTQKFGEGMSEYLDYGGSHASGNDIDFGTTKDGTRRRVERGEMVAIINKRNVNKYGVNNISDIIKSLNTGTFDDKYGMAFSGLSAYEGGTDLSSIEDGISTLVSQGEKRVIVSGNKTIEYYKNTKRIIRN